MRPTVGRRKSPRLPILHPALHPCHHRTHTGLAGHDQRNGRQKSATAGITSCLVIPSAPALCSAWVRISMRRPCASSCSASAISADLYASIAGLGHLQPIDVGGDMEGLDIVELANAVLLEPGEE